MDSIHVRRTMAYLLNFGNLQFNRRLLSLIPHAATQKLAKIIATMHDRSVEIFEEKKAALARGDEAVSRQIGEGKDIMSILSMPLIFLTSSFALRFRD